jgi:ribosomal-protein-alanine N-acetyltransferase
VSGCVVFYMTKRSDLQLKAKEVYLRPPQPDDYRELAALYRRSNGHFRGLVQQNFDKASFDRLLAEEDNPATEFFLIIRTVDDAIVGTIGLSQIFRRKFQNAYLGYMLGAGYTGNGYMREAVRLILRFAFRELKLHRVEANVQPENLPSIAVLKRAGFKKEGFSEKYLKISGQWRDHERWAIVRENWRPTR